MDDISVINEDWYIINSYHEKNDKIVDILESDSVTITSPINFKSKFMAPELNDFYKVKIKNCLLIQVCRVYITVSDY